MEGSGSLLKKGVTYSASGAVVDCLFCRLTSGREQATVVKSSDTLVAFKTIAPASAFHLLVSPMRHIQNIDALRSEDVALVREMKDFALSSLTPEQQKEQVSLTFHRPPYNSIDHIHLHCIVGPKNWLGFFKYLSGTPWCVDVDTLIAQLEKTPRL